MTATTSSKLLRASSNGTPIANATTDVVADPGDGFHIEVERIIVSNASATGTWCQFLAAGGTKYYNVWVTVSSPVILDFKNPWPLATSTKMQMVTSAAGSVEYTIEYRIARD